MSNEKIVRHSRMGCSNSGLGQNPNLPHCNSNGRFSSVSGPSRPPGGEGPPRRPLGMLALERSYGRLGGQKGRGAFEKMQDRQISRRLPGTVPTRVAPVQKSDFSA